MTLKPVLLLALGVLAALAFAGTHAQTVTLPGVNVPCTKQCGREANNTVCGNNHCCSDKGFCGLGPKYCDTGCQSGACRYNTRCDANTPCPNNQCCSPHGYCGFGIDYCGDGCSNGPCNKDHSCDNADLYCPNNLCCRGLDKKCGLGGNYCDLKDGDDAWKGCLSGPCYNKRCGSSNACTNDYCCSASEDGFCGIDQAYCGGTGVISVGSTICVLPPS